MMKGWGRLKLAAVAVVVAVVIVLVGNIADDLVLGRLPFDHGTLGSIDAWDVAVLHVVFTGIPIFALAAVRDDRTIMWLVAATLSAGIWGYFVWQTWRNSLTGFAGGADIGLGLIMIAAPFAILVILLALGLILRATRGNRR